MSYLDHLTAFLFDEKRRLSSKAAVVLFVILAILFVDDVLGFSHSFSVDKKIEQVQKLNTILKDQSTDSTTKVFALGLRSEIIKRQNIVNQILSFVQGAANNPNPHQTNSSKANNITKDSVKKSNFWFNITASGLYFLFAAIMIPFMLFTDKMTSFPQRLATGIATTIAFSLFGLFFIWALDFIPQISNSTWIWNYILNFLIQTGVFGLLVFAGQQKK